MRNAVATLVRDRRRFLRQNGFRVSGRRVEARNIRVGSRDEGISVVGVMLTKNGPRLVYRCRKSEAGQRPVKIQVLTLVGLDDYRVA